MDEIDVRLMKARMNVRIRQPFLGAVALTMQIEARPGILTMATDGVNLFYDPAFLDKVTESELTAVVAEEACHKAHKHHLRRGGRDPELWNIACDYQVHNDLETDGFKFPKAIEVDGEMRPLYIDPQYAGLSAEDIYHLLEEKKEEEQNEPSKGSETREGETEDEGMGSAGDESNPEEDEDEAEEKADDEGVDTGSDTESEDQVSDDVHNPDRDAGDDPSMEDSDMGEDAQTDSQTQEIGELAQSIKSGCGTILDAPDANAEIETEIALQECISVAKRAGMLPGYLQKLVKELVEPQTDWRTELRRFLSPSYRKDSTWARPNRRVLHAGLILPGYMTDGVSHLVIVVDGSGSIDYEALRRGISEIQDALENGGVDKVTMIYCDEHVYNEREYVTGETIEVLPAQCGGTRFAPAYEWIAENASDAVGVIYFTDMECSDWGALQIMFGAPPTLWAVYGDPRRFRTIQPPFGECIEINY